MIGRPSIIILAFACLTELVSSNVEAGSSFKCSPLGNLTFDMQDIQAPSLTGAMLRYGAFAVRNSAELRRYLLRTIGIDCITEDAKQVDKSIKSVKFPMIKLSDAEYQKASQYYEEEQAALKKNPNRYFGHKASDAYVTIEDYHKAYLSQTSNPETVVKNVLQAIGDFNPHLKAFKKLYIKSEIHRLAKESHQRYKEGKPKSMLDGIPFVVKDEMNVTGQRVLYGINPDSEMAKATPISVTNDPVVDALIDAGAIPISTCVMHELGISAVGYNTWYKGPHNAFNISHFTGGSSAGSATAVAAGIVPFAIGFDAGGSIRIPSAWSGVVGLAPTFGRVRFDTDELETFTTLHCGPITATVSDAAHVMSVIGNVIYNGKHFYDELYEKVAGEPEMPKMHLHALTHPIPEQKFKVGFFKDWLQFSEDEAQLALYLGLKFVERQWELESISLPNMGEQAATHVLTAATEFDISELGIPLTGFEYNTQINLALAREATKREGLIGALERLKGWSIEQWNEVFKKVDIIVTPAMPYGATVISDEFKKYGEFSLKGMSQQLRFMWPTDLVGFPSITVPAGVNSDGMPMGIQIIASHWKEDILLKAAMDLEAKLGRLRRHPPTYWRDILTSAEKF